MTPQEQALQAAIYGSQPIMAAAQALPITGNQPNSNSNGTQREQPAVYINFGWQAPEEDANGERKVFRSSKTNGIPLYESVPHDKFFIDLLRKPKIMASEDAQKIVAQGYLSCLVVTSVVDQANKREKPPVSQGELGLGGMMEKLGAAGFLD